MILVKHQSQWKHMCTDFTHQALEPLFFEGGWGGRNPLKACWHSSMCQVALLLDMHCC